jgi:hypothetical protein
MIRTDLCGGPYGATPYDHEREPTAAERLTEETDRARCDALTKALHLADLLDRRDGTSGANVVPWLWTANDLAGLIQRIEAAIKAGGTP